MENKTGYNLQWFVHEPNKEMNPLCGFKAHMMILSDSEDELVTCPNCIIHKKNNKS